MKILNAKTQETTELENTHQNIIDTISWVNKYASKPFEFVKFNTLVQINDINIDVDAIREIWNGDGWTRMEMHNGSSVTLYEFGKIRTFIF